MKKLDVRSRSICLPLLVGFSAVFAASNGLGQIRVLSQGNITSQWRSAQLEQVKLQLAATEPGTLRDELEAQQEWLTAWLPGKLDAQPLLTRKKQGPLTILREPTIDPHKRALRLREKLLGDGAKPTLDDTRALEKLLSDYPEDIGVKQLHLHWLDQPQYRSDYPREIAISAQRVFDLLQSEPASAELDVARAFTLYRKGRALTYRELPDVVDKIAIESQSELDAELQSTYFQLVEIAGSGRPEFISLEVHMLRHDRWFGLALALLERNGQYIDNRWLLEKRRDLLTELQWSAPAEEAAKVLAMKFPEDGE
ncbi:MAG: hypothetical protein KDB03_22390 [Planctomycetales bacterium]|nr:hypothetical protein [Planctomycetales bacterium]